MWDPIVAGASDEKSRWVIWRTIQTVVAVLVFDFDFDFVLFFRFPKFYFVTK